MGVIEIPVALPKVLKRHPRLPLMANVVKSDNWYVIITSLTRISLSHFPVKKTFWDKGVLQIVFIVGNPGMPTTSQQAALTELFVLYPLLLVVDGAQTTRLTGTFPTNVVTAGQLNRDGFVESRVKTLL